MKIETGEPKTTGRYACYMHGLAVPTVVRFWCVGQGWLHTLSETGIAGSVAGFIGPLPTWPENGIRHAPPLDQQEADAARAEPMKFDL